MAPVCETSTSAAVPVLPAFPKPIRANSMKSSSSVTGIASRALAVVLLLSGPWAEATSTVGATMRFEDAVKAVPSSRVVRLALTPGEWAASMDFAVSLRMRGFEELESRIQAGQAVSQAEMEASYLPAQADYDRISSWLKAEGFSIVILDKNHTTIFARGTVDQVASSLGVTFARVRTADGEFSSAVTAPSLPAEISGAVLTVSGLQPHIRMHHAPMRSQAVTVVSAHITPYDVDQAYKVPASLDGTGQTIAVIMGSVPLSSDLTAFWQDIGAPTTLSNFSVINVAGGPTSTSQTDNLDEATLDVEWSSGMAPGAQIRLYAIPGLDTLSFQEACTQVMNDGVARVITYSADGPESELPNSQLAANSQMLAQVVASGVTILASSGDGGSNPNPETDTSNGYSASNALIVSYPACDPNITAVGGTTLNVNSSWVATSEVVWSEIGQVSTNPLATGGGISSYFARPSWQAGPGVPSGTKRCLPDVAAMASVNPPSGNTGGVIVLNGQVSGLIGTSLSAPVWAGMAAVINEARSKAGLAPMGLLNRFVYPLIETTSFNDVTSGTNGAYSAGPGYDLCTGVGSPNITNLIAQMDAAVTETPAPSSPVNAGSSVSMSAVPQVTPATYQWQLGGVAIAGATNSTYTIPVAGATDNGNYSVTVTNSTGTFTYNLGALTTVSDARIINLSARADVQTGSNVLIAGFVIAGSGQKEILVRGVGPDLANFGVSGVLAAPVLTLFNSANTVIASNSAWGGGATLTNVMQSVGAFSLPKTSLDTALYQALSVGSYTAQVAGSNSTSGVALAEVYDADTGTPATRLINISARADVQAGANTLIAGFVITPGASGADETVLIRGVGPTLASFGVAGTLATPVLTVFDSKQVAVATNQGWATSPTHGPSTVSAGIEPATATTMTNVGAFGLAAGSADAAMTLTLPPGSYTAQVSSGSSAGGVGLVEVYEVK